MDGHGVVDEENETMTDAWLDDTVSWSIRICALRDEDGEVIKEDATTPDAWRDSALSWS
jgi:hypothetical protein